MPEPSRLKVYVESSVPSYLTARPTRDVVRLVKQQITREWWESRDQYELFISKTVLAEIERGDPDAAVLRTEAVRGIPVLSITEPIIDLVDALIVDEAVPVESLEDAYHIAIASVHGMDVLVTWNQKHIANVAKLRQIENVIRRKGFTPPVITTPDGFSWEDET